MKIRNILTKLYIFTVDTQTKINTGFWKLRLKKVGKSVEILYGCKFFHPTDVSIGDFVYINIESLFLSQGGEISIGNYVKIGPRCTFIASNHDISQMDKPMYMVSEVITGKIVIKDDVWIGANVTILPNVTIGKGAVLGAGAVVTSNVPSYAVAGGVPARVIKFRTKQKTKAHFATRVTPEKHPPQSDSAHISNKSFGRLRFRHPRILNSFVLISLLAKIKELLYTIDL